MGTINNFGNILQPAGSSTVDVQALLTAALTAAKAPLTQLQQQQTTQQTQQTALQGIQQDVASLQTALQGLTDPLGGVSAQTASSSDQSLLTATADATAQSGTHTVVVSSLATTSSYYSDPLAAASTPLTAGSFQLAVGANAPVTVTVDGTDNTLSGLAAAINGQNLGVTASVISDASGARLALVSNTSGGSGNIVLSANSSGLVFHQAAGGANAALTVDGVPINSSSNNVTGVIPGVALNLVGAAPGSTVTVTVVPDLSQAGAAISQFVSAWNTVIQDVNTQFNVQSDGSGGGPLETDGNLRTVQNQLLAAVTASISGNNGLVNLASLGVNLNTDGTLTLNSGTLANALNGNFAAVQTLLQGSGSVGAFLTQALTQVNDPVNGTITLDLQGMQQNAGDLTQQINSLQAALTTETQSLTAQYAQMQTTLNEMPLLQQQITAQLAALSNG